MVVSIDSLLSMFRRINDPTDSGFCSEYQDLQNTELLNIAKLVSSKYCYAIEFEKAMVNPNTSDSYPTSNCGSCNNCTGDHLFPVINRSGCVSVIFDIFVSGRNTITTPKTLDNVTNVLRDYPNINHLLFNSSQTKVLPVMMKKVLFVLIANGVIEMVFDISSKEIHLRIAKVKNENQLAIYDDNIWLNILCN